MSATPEQIAERLEWRAEEADRRKAGAEFNGMGFMAAEEVATAKTLRAAAALIRAQAERVRVLESVFGHYHVGPGDKCGQCGLDLRDRVHTRAVQS